MEHSKLFQDYDCIVIGGGHAGCEAAAAAANLGSRVLLITMNLAQLAQMSCNPSIGGIAKGQIVREIDALGGFTGIVSDKSMIQFRMLNMSKGPAMWSPRAQNDRMLFSMYWREVLESIQNLDFLQDQVVDLIIEEGKLKGIITEMGYSIYSQTVILTAGTFLNGRIHIGTKKFEGGRMGDRASNPLTQHLASLGIKSGRLKTGTSPRIDGRSIDFSKLAIQPGDDPPGGFSFLEIPKEFVQRPCYLAYTNSATHKILEKGFEFSPMFSGTISGRGPRYCPSIEDKLYRFSSKESHQLFLEPDGRTTIEYYISGFSSSLPDEIQISALRQIEGLENVKFFRPGYAIEYDFFHPEQLDTCLQSKIVENLFFAGQVNGTTGYEEAAAQGLIAGINAHMKSYKLPAFQLKRSEAYIGVLIDDLVTKNIEEPYRMFTSRAEFRTLLRQDNADYRLTPRAFSIGLASKERMNLFENKYKRIAELTGIVKNLIILPEAKVNQHLTDIGSVALEKQISFESLLLRPQVGLRSIIPFLEFQLAEPDRAIFRASSSEVIDEVEILIKYNSYIAKELEVAGRINRFEDLKIPINFEYKALQSLSLEAREKLQKYRPLTIGQASRIDGVSPSDISVLIVYMDNH
ncbi:MAG: tRNA uridine-5-carboxymethylaminomethyl(34) synthesis enzyme MnmG [Bacteroidales bacterium]|nr:tRNA uridine-5-carboxymethylaminomethyl(34) synthesis enzyme MnmG [Bacteroidales bacterium]